MNVKYRLAITKGEAVRYISHLDYARTIERALRRAKLPVAYSEGFNPHMKIAFGSALSLGVASEAEYLDIELSAELPTAAVEAALAPQLPPAITLKGIKEISSPHAALMAVISLAAYRIDVPLTTGAGYQAAAAAVDAFNRAAAVSYVKESPKGRRTVDVKQYVDTVAVAGRDDKIELSFTVRITPTGSVKPAEVLAALAADFALPVEPAMAQICRTGLFVADGSLRVNPMDV